MLFGPGALVSAERIAPAVAAFIIGVLFFWLAWVRRKSPMPAVVINQAPGAGGPAWGINPRGGDGGEHRTVMNVPVEPGETYPIIVGKGGRDGRNGGDTVFGDEIVRAKGGKSAPQTPGAFGLPGADGAMIITYDEPVE